MDQDDSQICLLFVVSALVRTVFGHKNSRNSFKKLLAKLKPFASV